MTTGNKLTNKMTNVFREKKYGQAAKRPNPADNVDVNTSHVADVL